jgi:hypothetical protein
MRRHKACRNPCLPADRRPGLLFDCFDMASTVDALVERGLVQPRHMLHSQR